jgi:signal transduction histidine kinase
MSHELRTPLNSVIGFAAVLLKNKGGGLKPDEITYLSRIQANGRHLLGLIDQVLDLTRVEAGETRLEVVATELGGLVRATVEQLKGHVGESHQPPVEACPTICSRSTRTPTGPQVIINLLGNAPSSPERGSVTVRVAADERTRRPNRIDVIDTGSVSPRAAGDHLRSAPAGGDGTRASTAAGPGLTISRSLCRLMGYGSGSTAPPPR